MPGERVGGFGGREKAVSFRFVFMRSGRMTRGGGDRTERLVAPLPFRSGGCGARAVKSSELVPWRGARVIGRARGPLLNLLPGSYRGSYRVVTGGWVVG